MSLLWIEFAVLFIIMPALVYFGLLPVRMSIPILLLAAGATAYVAISQGATLAQLGVRTSTENTLGCLTVGLGAWAVAQTVATVIQYRQGLGVFPFAMSKPRLFALLT